jgi:hypothetical protein
MTFSHTDNQNTNEIFDRFNSCTLSEDPIGPKTLTFVFSYVNKVRVMQSYSTSFFCLIHRCLDAVFDTDRESDLIFSFRPSFQSENATQLVKINMHN